MSTDNDRDREGCRSARAGHQRLPPWFRVGLGVEGHFRAVQNQIRVQGLHTVCESARCPNRNECWNAGTATFLILGDTCTRRCGFCGVRSGTPQPVDAGEPGRVAEAIQALDLKYAVITSVTRDDLPDGGASLFADTIRSVKRAVPGCGVEVLIPDFKGSIEALQTVLEAGPDVLNHNIETVPSLYPRVRPQADYARSLELLRRAKDGGAVTKSGLMLGLGEGPSEIHFVLTDLRACGCDQLVLGQYLQPSPRHMPVIQYVHPEAFRDLERRAISSGFSKVVSGPLARSSYHAGQAAQEIRAAVTSV